MNIQNEQVLPSVKNEIKILSPREKLVNVIDPSKDVKPIFEKYYHDIYAVQNETGNASYSQEEVSFLSKVSAEDLFENMMDNSKYLLDLREKATSFLKLNSIMLDSHYEKTAEKLYSRMIKYSKDWLNKYRGQNSKLKFDTPIEEIVEAINYQINDQTKFASTQRNLNNSLKCSIVIPTHQSEENSKNDKFLDRIDNGIVIFQLSENGKIRGMSISERLSLANFSNSIDEIPIILLAKEFPDNLVSKFNYSVGGGDGECSQEPNTKIPLTSHVHDYGEMQYWVNLYGIDNTTNEDYISVIKIWVNTLHAHPRIPKINNN